MRSASYKRQECNIFLREILDLETFLNSWNDLQRNSVIDNVILS